MAALLPLPKMPRMPASSNIEPRDIGPQTRLELAGAQLHHARGWIDAVTADRYLQCLPLELAFSQHRVRLFGREYLSPRLSAWVGDEDAVYRYSGVVHEPLPWTETLLEIRRSLELATGTGFNSVLVNRYRDGADSMGWHADDERELGPQPTIASVSLGATRSFRFKSKSGGASLAIELTHGSLLLMAGATQSHYRHAVPKTRKVVGERINLTFRDIRPGLDLGRV